MFFKKVTYKFCARFVYRLGHIPFTDGRGVRFPYRVPLLVLFMEKVCVHQANAPSMTSLSAGTRNTVDYIRKTRDAGINKYATLKANGSRAIAVHNVDNTTNGKRSMYG